MVAKVLTRMGATVQARAMQYKVVVELVLLYGRENWVVTGENLKVLEGFHNQVARMITGKTSQSMVEGEWE